MHNVPMNDQDSHFIEETVGREIFRFAQHPPHTRFDTMGGFFDQYKELLGTLSRQNWSRGYKNSQARLSQNWWKIQVQNS